MFSRSIAAASTLAIAAVIGGTVSAQAGTASAAEGFTLLCFQKQGNNVERYTYTGQLDRLAGGALQVNGADLRSDIWDGNSNYGPSTFRGHVASLHIAQGDANASCYYLNQALRVSDYRYGYWV
ncbi:hypothetical protein [Williamsia sp. CHRR-6]|uniref:hypothetical protein n=1 Tax=Williamsia sp. CHRR-6 TaxID=2835871 RepID=UPI001BD98E26|nr:hypothetical protein [Williamsia sp. CHRR-6]MBT0565751.1 hypothetical protein [Williamsia sp. CHRR-6]